MSQEDFVFQKGSSIRVGKICLSCKSNNNHSSKTSQSNSQALSKSDINKLLSFSENPEKYATGTTRAAEKVEVLENLKDKFSEGQLVTYTKARQKYDEALIKKKESKVQKKDYSSVLSEAFNTQRSVKIRYKGMSRTIDPYSFDGTYVVAYCHYARDIRTFRTDRIQGAELSNAFIPDKALLNKSQSKLTEAPSYTYTGYRRHGRRY